MQRELPAVVHRLKRALPRPVRGALRRLLGRDPPVGEVGFGDLRRTRPIDPEFGFNRGTPIDRFYIERFLRDQAAFIRGAVLEIGDDTYTRAFGGTRVERGYVLHVTEGYPGADFVGDLASGDHLPSATFDCVILTQTLHLIFDFPAALRTLERIIRPGGALLLTVPGITQIDRGEWGATWYWSFTVQSITRLLTTTFGTAPTLVSYGNVLAATSFLQGLAAHELRTEELLADDPAYPVIVAACARKLADPDTLAEPTAASSMPSLKP